MILLSSGRKMAVFHSYAPRKSHIISSSFFSSLLHFFPIPFFPLFHTPPSTSHNPNRDLRGNSSSWGSSLTWRKLPEAVTSMGISLKTLILVGGGDALMFLGDTHRWNTCAGNCKAWTFSSAFQAEKWKDIEKFTKSTIKFTSSPCNFSPIAKKVS